MGSRPVLIGGEDIDLVVTTHRIHLTQFQFWAPGTYYCSPEGLRERRRGPLVPFTDLSTQRRIVLTELWARSLRPDVHAAIIVPDDVRLKGDPMIRDTAIITESSWEQWVIREYADPELEQTVRSLIAPEPQALPMTEYELAGLML